MLSTIAKRSVIVARPTIARAVVARYATSRLMSMRVDQTIDHAEELSKDLHWTDVKDELHSVKHLMNEEKTNHNVLKPDVKLETYVEEQVNELQRMMLEAPIKNHGEVFGLVHDLKLLVKSKLYP